MGRWLDRRQRRLVLVTLLPVSIVLIASMLVSLVGDRDDRGGCSTLQAATGECVPTCTMALITQDVRCRMVNGSVIKTCLQDQIDSAHPCARDLLEARRAASAELDDISKDLSALATAILAALIFIVRERHGNDRSPRFINGVLAAVILSITSIYFSIRLRFGTALQNWDNAINLPQAEPLALFQILSLIGALSILLLLAASVYLPRRAEPAEPDQ